MSEPDGPGPRQYLAGGCGLLAALWLLGSLLLGLVLLPLLALALNQSPQSLAEVAGMADVRAAIELSLAGAFVATAFAAALGVPLAWLLARAAFPGRAAIAAIIDLPLAVPHTVAGIALLFVFGRRGIVGAPAETLFGLQFWSSFAGIVVAMLFVAAPYTVNAARIGFEAIDPRLEMVARTLGLGPWGVLCRISLPLARRGIATGLTLTFARALSEFGAIVIIAYFPKTAPVMIYELFLRFGIREAAAMSVLLLAISLALFVLLRALAFGRPIAGGQR